MADVDPQLLTDDALVVQPYDLQPQTADALSKGTENDIYNVIQRIDEWRNAQDLLCGLLTNLDETELHRHILGIVARPGSTENGEPGLVWKLYGDYLSPKAKGVLLRVQHSDTDETFAKNCTARRLQYHFLLFATLAIENEFAQYVVLRTFNRDGLRSLINGSIKPLLSNLLQGTLPSGGAGKPLTDAEECVSDFVNACRLSYFRSCVPRPVMACAGTPGLHR